MIRSLILCSQEGGGSQVNRWDGNSKKRSFDHKKAPENIVSHSVNRALEKDLTYDASDTHKGGKAARDLCFCPNSFQIVHADTFLVLGQQSKTAFVAFAIGRHAECQQKLWKGNSIL